MLATEQSGGSTTKGAGGRARTGPSERVVDDLIIESELGSRGHAVRITADPQDLGVVYGGSPKRIGRKVARTGGGKLIE
jgi:hypothetical protein